MLAVSIAASAADTLRVDLNKALEIALSDNPTIKIADKEIERVDYSKKAAWYGLIPSLSASGMYTRNVKRQTMSMGGLNIVIGQDNSAQLAVNLSLPLIVPALWRSIQMTELDMQLAVESARASSITLRNDVQKAFYGILLAQDSYEALKEGYDLAKQNYENAKQRYDLGAAAEYDLVSSEVQMRNLMPNVLQVENGVKQSKLYLKVLMGLDATVEVVVDGTLVDFEDELKEFDKDQNTQLTNNPDLAKLDIQQKILTKALQMQRTQRMPTLVGFGQYTYAGAGNDKEEISTFNPMAGLGELFAEIIPGYTPEPPTPTPAGMNWYDPAIAVGLQLSIPIFSGFTHITKEKQLKIQALELNMQREYLENVLSMQAITALDNMGKAVEQVQSTKDNVRLSQKGYDISQKRYDTGAGTMLELQGAALALTQSKLSYSQAISDYLNAKSEFEKIVGKYIPM
jgi:outer membrane protein TolC